MKDERKTKRQLIAELVELRQRLDQQPSSLEWAEVFQAIGHPTLILDPQHVVLAANQAALRALGTGANEIVGKKCHEVFHHSGQPPECCPMEVMRESEELESAEMEIEALGTSFLVSCTPVLDSKGNLDKVIHIATDIANLKQTESRLAEAERRFSTLLDNVRLVAVGLDQDGSIAYANPYLLELTGYSLDQVLGQSWFETLIPERDRPEIDAVHRGFISQALRPHHENPILTKDGQERLIAWNNTLLLDPDGEPVGTMSIGEDITERHQAENALRESELLYRSLIDNAQDAIVIFDGATGTIQDANQAAQSMLDRSLEELQQIDQSEIIAPEEVETGQARHRQILQQEHLGPQQYTFVAPDGRRTPVEAKSNQLEFDDRSLIISFFRDITEHRQAERKLWRYAERLRTLHAIDGTILAAWSPREIAEAALRHLLQLVPCEQASVTTFDLEAKQATILALHSELETSIAAGKHMPLDAIGCIDSLRQGKPDVVPDTQDLAEPTPLENTLIEENLRSCIKTPLIAHGELIGSLNLCARRPNTFIPEYVDIVREVADEVAVALHQTRLRAKLEAEEQRLEVMVTNLPEGILLLDGEWHILLANPSAQRFLPALTNATVGDVLVSLAGQPIEEVVKRPTQRAEIIGPPRWVFEITACPVPVGPRTQGWMLVIRDQTEQQATQARIQQQDRLAAVGQLAGGIAHDFNNLLTTIMLYAQMPLDKNELPPDTARSLQTILDESRRAATLIQQILDFSRRSSIETKPVDLKPFIQEATQVLQRTIPENISLLFEVGGGSYVINADPTRIQQVLMNLVVNSRDSMPNGGRLRISLSRVQVALDQEPPTEEMMPGPWVCLAVSDTGSGIPDEVLPHIFEPFYTTKPFGEGTGLGLAQVYGIVKQHGGHILVDTELGKGTTFRVYLPARQQTQGSDREQELAATAPQGNGELILLVEDNERIREAGQGILESLNYAVVTAENGQEALDLYAARDIDLIITDVVMPEMGGLDLLQALGEREPKPKALAITGHVLEQEVETLKEAGIQAIVYKPFDLHTLAQAVYDILHKD